MKMGDKSHRHEDNAGTETNARDIDAVQRPYGGGLTSMYIAISRANSILDAIRRHLIHPHTRSRGPPCTRSFIANCGLSRGVSDRSPRRPDIVSVLPARPP